METPPLRNHEDTPHMEGKESLENSLFPEETLSDRIFDAESLAGDLFYVQDDFEDLTKKFLAFGKDPNVHKALITYFEQQIGQRQAQLFLESAPYRESLFALRKRVLSPLFEGGPQIMREISFEKLVFLRDMLGANPEDLLHILDLKQRLAPDAGANIEYEDENLISIVGVSVDRTTKQLTGSCDLSFTYRTATDENMSIHREFTRTLEKNQDGQMVVLRRVRHALFELPESLKANGIAATITQESLSFYDQNTIDEITLTADIDLGSYAWAAYGYGFDMKKNALDVLDKPEFKDIPVNVGGVQKKIQECTTAEKNMLLETETMYLYQEKIKMLVARGIQRIREAQFATASEEGNDVIALLAQLRNQPFTLTPQTLAHIGRGGPIFYWDKDMGRWYNDQTLEKAVANGDMTEEHAQRFRKKPFHLGKVALLNNAWQGKIELKATGSQKGANRAMLEQYLQGATA